MSELHPEKLCGSCELKNPKPQKIQVAGKLSLRSFQEWFFRKQLASVVCQSAETTWLKKAM